MFSSSNAKSSIRGGVDNLALLPLPYVVSYYYMREGVVKRMDVEWLILADYAQMAENKLYLIGGGWDRLTVNTKFPLQQNIGIAVSIQVPWNETNQPGNFEVSVQSQDGVSLATLGGQFKVGRPPDHPQGEVQRAQIAANLPIEIKEPGIYVIVATLEGQEMKRVPFFVVPGPLLAMQRAAQE
jgi:hypothetical protein